VGKAITWRGISESLPTGSTDQRARRVVERRVPR